MEKTKDKEVDLLQKRIDNWDKYIEMLQFKFEEADRIQRDKLLMDMLNVDSQEELYNKLETDMEGFIDFLNNNNDSTKVVYDNYNTIFSRFLNSYKNNLIYLQQLQQQQIQIMDASRLMQLNNGLYAGLQIQSPTYNPNASNVSGKTLPAYDVTKDYSSLALSAARTGNKELTRLYYNYRTRKQNDPAYKGKGFDVRTQDSLYKELTGIIGSFATGLDEGPVTETGLAILHGTKTNPEYVLNSEQTYQMLKNLTSKDLTSRPNIEDDRIKEEAIKNAEDTVDGIDEILKKLNTVISNENLNNTQLATIITIMQNFINTQNAIRQFIETDGAQDKEFYTNITEDFDTFKEDLFAKLNDILYGLSDKLDQVKISIDSTGPSFESIISGIGNLSGSIAELGPQLGQVGSNIVTSIGNLGSSLSGLGSMSVPSYEQNYGGFLSGGLDDDIYTEPVTNASTSLQGDKTMPITPYGGDWSQAALDYARQGDAETAFYCIKKRAEKLEELKTSAPGKYKASLAKYTQPKLEAEVRSLLHSAGVPGYAEGIEEGPVTETGLAMLHGTPDSPEYVLNNDQTYQMLKNLSTKDLSLNDNTSSGETSNSSNFYSEASKIEWIISKLNTLISNGNLSNAQLATVITLMQNLSGLSNLLSEEFNKDSIRYTNLSTILNSIKETVANDLRNDTTSFQQIIEAITSLTSSLMEKLDGLKLGLDDIHLNITETGDRLHTGIGDTGNSINGNISETGSVLNGTGMNIDKNVQAINTNVVSGLGNLRAEMNSIASTNTSVMGGGGGNTWSNGKETVELAPGQATKYSQGPIGGIEVTRRTAGGTYGYDTEGTKYVQANTGDWIKADPKGWLGISSERRQDLAGKSVYIGGKIVSYDSLGYYKGYRPASGDDDDDREDDVRESTGSGSSTRHENKDTIKYGDPDHYDKYYVDEKGNRTDDPNKAYGIEYERKKGYAEGIEEGPVTETGLTMLHGTPSSPEYVLNSDQAYQMLKNISTMDMTNQGNERPLIENQEGTGAVTNNIEETSDLISKLNTIISNENLSNSQLATIITLMQTLNMIPNLLNTEYSKNSMRYNNINTLLTGIKQIVNSDLENDVENFAKILEALSAANDKITSELGNLNIGVGDANTNITGTGDKLDTTITDTGNNINTLETNIDKNVQSINGNVVTGLNSVSSGMTLLASGLNGRGHDLVGNYPISSDKNLWSDGNDIVQLAPGQATKSSLGPVGGIKVSRRTAGGTYGYDSEGTKYIQANTGDWIKVDPKGTLGVSGERRQDLAGKSVYIGGKILSYDELGYYKGYRPPSSKNEEEDIRSSTGASSATSHNIVGIEYGDPEWYNKYYVDEKGNRTDASNAYGIEYELKPGKNPFTGIGGSSGGGSRYDNDDDDDDDDRTYSSSSGSGASIGASIGSAFGPIGAVVGTVIGSVLGGSSKSSSSRDVSYSSRSDRDDDSSSSRGSSGGSSSKKDYSKTVTSVRTNSDGSKTTTYRDGSTKTTKSKGYAGGLNEGPVTFTGLATLHGTPQKPEYVLNNDQAYNILRNLARNNMPEFEKNIQNNEGIAYVLNGDINLKTDTNPAEFWDEVTNAMGRRLNVTKNNRR